MKRLACAIVILVLVASLSTVSCVCIAKRTDELEKSLMQCMTYCMENDEAKAYADALDIAAACEKDMRLFNTFMNHNDAQELFTALPMLPVHAGDSVAQLYEKCAECLNLVRIIKRTVYPHWDTVM